MTAQLDYETTRREWKNARVRELLATAKADGPGYIAVSLAGRKVHAAATTIRGHSGYIHPRALCQPHTPRSYAVPWEDDREITCQRCLASLAGRGV